VSFWWFSLSPLFYLNVWLQVQKVFDFLNKPLLKKMKTALAQLLMKRIERLTVFEMNRVAECLVKSGKFLAGHSKMREYVEEVDVERPNKEKVEAFEKALALFIHDTKVNVENIRLLDAQNVDELIRKGSEQTYVSKYGRNIRTKQSASAVDGHVSIWERV
jgi:hypothetical protein